jgi:hypothetical protein
MRSPREKELTRLRVSRLRGGIENGLRLGLAVRIAEQDFTNFRQL